MYDGRDFSYSGPPADGGYQGAEAAWADSRNTIPSPRWEAQSTFGVTDLDLAAQQWSPDEELARLLAQQQGPPPLPAGRSRQDRRRRRPRLSAAAVSLRAVSFGAAALVALIGAMVSVLSGVIAYDPLHLAATQGISRSPVASWWPVLVYGPWLVASVSVLRAALHRKQAAHSWAVVLLFSAAAVALCLTQAPHTVTGLATAGIPPVAALTCFHQLVRQITLTRPIRQPEPRHRNASHAAR